MTIVPHPSSLSGGGLSRVRKEFQCEELSIRNSREGWNLFRNADKRCASDTGRKGVGLQAGLRWMFGSDPSPYTKSPKTASGAAPVSQKKVIKEIKKIITE